MTHELFYTSAPKGLNPGAHGFCTVAATRGLPPQLAEKLEAISAYRPLFPSLDPKAALNPVVHAHLRVTVAGRPVSVLSRIGPAGLDYTSRNNKLAHHVVLESGEQPPGGPAWLLQQPGFLEPNWDGQVRHLPSGRRPPWGDVSPAVCRAWQQQTGDAGWGGVLAEAFATDANQPVYLVCEPGLDPLPLLGESLALLPAELRWRVTFSTYFTGLPQDVSCNWRCVYKGSAEAAGRLPNARCIDLTAPLGPARGGVLVEQARTGQTVPGESLPPPVPEWPADRADEYNGHPAREVPTVPQVPRVPVPATEVPAPPMPPALTAPRRRPELFSFLAGAGLGVLVTLAVSIVWVYLNGLPGQLAGRDKRPGPQETERETGLRELEEREANLQVKLAELATKEDALRARENEHETSRAESVRRQRNLTDRERQLDRREEGLQQEEQALAKQRKDLAIRQPFEAPARPNGEDLVFRYVLLNSVARSFDLQPRDFLDPGKEYRLRLLGLDEISKRKPVELSATGGERGSLIVSLKARGDKRLTLAEIGRDDRHLRWQWGDKPDEKEAKKELADFTAAQRLVEYHTVLEIVNRSDERDRLLVALRKHDANPIRQALVFPEKTRQAALTWLDEWAGFDLYLGAARLEDGQEFRAEPGKDVKRLESKDYSLEIKEVEPQGTARKPQFILELQPKGDRGKSPLPRLVSLVVYRKIEGRLRMDVFRVEAPKKN